MSAVISASDWQTSAVILYIDVTRFGGNYLPLLFSDGPKKHWWFSDCLSILGVGGVGIESQGLSKLLSMYSYNSHPIRSFSLVFMECGLILCRPWYLILLFVFPHIVGDDRHMPLCRAISCNGDSTDLCFASS
jgi:hypothetical protein